METNIGARIKQIRIARNLSQYDLAKKSNYLRQSQISKIEKGIRKVSVRDLIEFAQILEVSVEEILNFNKSA